MKFIETLNSANSESVKLAYEDYGSGQPVILIHGWPLSKEMWEYQAEMLVDAGLRVITYDRRGFGKSDKPWSGYDYNTLADDLKAVIDKLELTDVTLVGFSMGGGEVARYFTRHQGQRVSKIILISTVLPYLSKTDDNQNGVPPDQLNQMMEEVKKDRIGFLDSFGKTFFGVNLLSHPISAPALEYYRMLASFASPKATKECMKSFGFTDFREDVKSINVPTLIIHGDADKIVPMEGTSNITTQLIPNSNYVVYEGAPHGLWYTAKDRLANDLVSFITSNTVSAYPAAGDSGYVILPSNEEPLVI